MKRKKGYFSISAVAEMFSIHQQTIRLYEKEGLISPKRSEGNTRLFSEEDLDRLEEIIYLTHTAGINLAGVQMILKLQKKLQGLQQEMNDLFAKTQKELGQEVDMQAAVAKQHAERLVTLRNKEKTGVLLVAPTKPVKRTKKAEGDNDVEK